MKPFSFTEEQGHRTLNPVTQSRSEEAEAPELQKAPQPPPERLRSDDCSGERAGSSPCGLGTSKRLVGFDEVPVEEFGRERLKRHRMETAGRVWIPETWGQESLLKGWIDCSVFDRPLVPKGVVSARQALVEECRRAKSGELVVDNRC